MEKGSKKRRSALEMELLIKQWQESGQSRAEFCREEGIASWILQYWLSRYEENSPSGADIGFSEIRVKEKATCFDTGTIKIKHPCGIELELSQGTSASYLRELLGW